MREIKFSNFYEKLRHVVNKDFMNARLLQAVRIHYKELSESMINYDTVYLEGEKKEIKRYELPKTDLILLIFISEWNVKLFTTIRAYDPEKYDYYKSLEGEMMSVVLTTPEAKKNMDLQ